MGRVFQKALIQNSADIFKNQEGLIEEGDIKSLDIEFLVDTGASLICLPTSMIEKLGLLKKPSRRAKTANGTVERNIYSPVKITIGDRDAHVEVMEIPETVEAPPLLGYIALELLDLYVNPKGQNLIGNPETNGEMMYDLY